MKLNFIKKDNELWPIVENVPLQDEIIENVQKCTVSSTDKETFMTITVLITDKPAMPTKRDNKQ